MSLDEFVDKYSKEPLNISREESVQIMREAKIIDEDGFLNPLMFSKETVKENRRANKPFI